MANVPPKIGVTHKLGRKRPGPEDLDKFARASKFGVGLTLPPVDSWDWASLCAPALATMLANDTVGDCTAACTGHLLDIFTASDPKPALVTDTEALAFYSRCTSPPYDPSNPSTDTGADIATVLDVWAKGGYLDPSDAPKGSVRVASGTPKEAMSAMYFFGGLVGGLELPDAYTQSSMLPTIGGPIITWDLAGPPVPDNGHCVLLCGVTAQGCWIITWGCKVFMTWQAFHKYFTADAGGELFGVIDPDWCATMAQKSPSGLDWAGITKEFAALGGGA